MVRHTTAATPDVLSQKWRAFSAIAITYITNVLAASMAFLLLDPISEHFGVTLRAVGWVVITEALMVSALVLPLGALGDSLGRKRVLLAGSTVFGLGAIATGLAPSFALLIVGRIVMAFGSALVQSVATGVVVASFPPEERGLALGSQTTAVAIGSVSGPLVAGLGLSFFDWNELFLLIGIPSALSVLAILFLVPDDTGQPNDASQPHQPDAAGRRFDGLGAMFSATAVTVLVVTITNPFNLSWLSPIVLLSALAGVALIGAFVWWELRVDRPMLELRLFALSEFRTAAAVRVLGFGSSTTVRFLFPVYLLSLREISPRSAGLLLALNAVGLGSAAQISGRLYDRTGPRLPATTGMSIQIVASVVLAVFASDTPLIVTAFMLFFAGFGVGLWNVPSNSAMLGAMPASDLGVGGAFTNVTRTIGSVMGQAATAAIVVAIMTSQGFDVPLDELSGTADAGGSFLDGWRVMFFLCAAVAAFTLLLATRLPGAPAARVAEADYVRGHDSEEHS